jgi:hypothetical protein
MAATAASYAFQTIASDKAVRNGLIAGGSLALLGAGLASYVSVSSHRDAAHVRAKECLSLVIQHTPDRINCMQEFLERYDNFFASIYRNRLSSFRPRCFSDPKVSDSTAILADFANPLKDLKKLAKRLGFCSGPLIVCDGLDEADLLDPSKYPGVLNHLVREICYFNILNRYL